MSKPTPPTLSVTPVDYGHLAQQAAEEHLQACWANLDDDGEEPETAAPFCGCLTCEVRETLHAAYPFLVQGWEAERNV